MSLLWDQRHCRRICSGVCLARYLDVAPPHLIEWLENLKPSRPRTCKSRWNSFSNCRRINGRSFSPKKSPSSGAKWRALTLRKALTGHNCLGLKSFLQYVSAPSLLIRSPILEGKSEDWFVVGPSESALSVLHRGAGHRWNCVVL